MDRPSTPVWCKWKSAEIETAGLGGGHCYGNVCVALVVDAKRRSSSSLPRKLLEPLLSTVHAADPKSSIQLIKGFHGVEQNSWRWTMGRFAVTLKPPIGAAEQGAAAGAEILDP